MHINVFYLLAFEYNKCILIAEHLFQLTFQE